MHFIEHWIHVAPDGGDGTLELLLAYVVPVALVALVAGRRLARALRWVGERARAATTRIGSTGPCLAASPRLDGRDVA
jgi:hypothetical protein